MKKQLLAIVLVIAISTSFVPTVYAGNSKAADPYTAIIEGFAGKSVTQVQKELGQSYKTYNKGFSYQYVSFQKFRYNEIRFFYDSNNSSNISEVCFQVEYSSYGNALEDYIWSLNQKFGTPEKYTESLKNGPYVENYRYHTEDGTVARVKIIASDYIEVSYHYNGVEEADGFAFWEIDANYDYLDLIHSIYKTPDVRSHNTSTEVWYALDGKQTFSLCEEYSPISGVNACFDKDGKLTSLSFRYEPFYTLKELYSIAELNYSMDLYRIKTYLNENCTPLPTEDRSRDGWIRYKWQGENGLAYKIEDYGSYIYLGLNITR